jgi:hypothetical protein
LIDQPVQTASVPTPSTTGRKSDGLANLVLVGTSFVGGGSVVFAAFQLIREEPDRAFKLLQAWGPGFLLALFIAWCLREIINRALDVAARVGDRLAGSMENVATQQQSLAEAAHAQALALQTTADKDDREKQEMQILIGVVNSKVEQTLDEQKRQNRALERIEDALKINRPLNESESK